LVTEGEARIRAEDETAEADNVMAHVESEEHRRRQ